MLRASNRLSWKPAVASHRQSSRRVAGAASSLLARGKGCSSDIALRMYYNAGVRALYAFSLVTLRATQWETLETAHRGIIRRLFGLPSNVTSGHDLCRNEPVSPLAQSQGLCSASRGAYAHDARGQGAGPSAPVAARQCGWPSHVGVRGNEAADALAKDAPPHPPNFVHSFDVARQIIARHVRALHPDPPHSSRQTCRTPAVNGNRSACSRFLAAPSYGMQPCSATALQTAWQGQPFVRAVSGRRDRRTYPMPVPGIRGYSSPSLQHLRATRTATRETRTHVVPLGERCDTPPCVPCAAGHLFGDADLFTRL
ncbi:hypothetical protein MRX96_038462 [Rhipicephalus microplus]